LGAKAGEKVKFSCPANNIDATTKADFVSAAGVRCKACSHRVAVKDLDTTKDKFWVGLQWGPLMNDAGVFVEAAVTGYQVSIVDSNKRVLKVVGQAPKVTSSTTCCTGDLYSFTASGTLPVGYARFMITPTFGTDDALMLPMGVLTDAILDVTAGIVTKVKGSFTMKVSNAAAFKTNPKVEMALREAVADTLVGIEKDHIVITGIVDVDRRLSEERMLGGHTGAGSVKVEYEIMVPQTYTGATITAASFKPATLMTNINKRITSKGVAGVSVTEAPVVAKPTMSSSGTPLQTAAADRSAALGFLVGLVGVAALLK